MTSLILPVITAAVGLIVGYFLRLRSWLRERRLEAYSDLLGAFTTLSRSYIDQEFGKIQKRTHAISNRSDESSPSESKYRTLLPAELEERDSDTNKEISDDGRIPDLSVVAAKRKLQAARAELADKRRELSSSRAQLDDQKASLEKGRAHLAQLEGVQVEMINFESAVGRVLLIGSDAMITTTFEMIHHISQIGQASEMAPLKVDEELHRLKSEAARLLSAISSRGWREMIGPHL